MYCDAVCMTNTIRPLKQIEIWKTISRKSVLPFQNELMLNTNTQINNEKRLDHNFTCFHNHSDNAKTSNICRFRSNRRLDLIYQRRRILGRFVKWGKSNRAKHLCWEILSTTVLAVGNRRNILMACLCYIKATQF